MIDISTELLKSFKSSTPNFCLIMKMTLKDGTVLGFNDVNKDITIDNVTYKKSSAISPSAIESTSDLSVDNLEMTGLLNQDVFTDKDVRGGRFSGARVQFYRIDWKFPHRGVMKLPTGFVGDITIENTKFTMEIRGLSQIIQNDVGRTYLPSCDAEFGDERCGYDRSSVTVTGSVAQTNILTTVTDVNRTEADNYFDYGVFTFTSGENSGYSMEIKNFSNGVFELILPFPFAINDGDTYTAYAGCDKTKAMCKDRYNNFRRFKGFPSIPNPSVTLQVG